MRPTLPRVHRSATLAGSPLSRHLHSHGICTLTGAPGRATQSICARVGPLFASQLANSAHIAEHFTAASNRTSAMTMVFQRVTTPGIAQISYLIGDDATGTAAVVDPRPHVDVYLQLARNYGLAITHIFETHIHADFMTGSRELAGRLGNAEIYASREGQAEYGFSTQPIQAGDQFQFGSVLLTARHTPGHTPEHLSYEVAEPE